MKNKNIKNRCPAFRPARMAAVAAALSFTAASVLTGCHGDAKFEPEPGYPEERRRHPC